MGQTSRGSTSSSYKVDQLIATKESLSPLGFWKVQREVCASVENTTDKTSSSGYILKINAPLCSPHFDSYLQ